MDTKKMENSGYVATIGMFDGVHRGHQFVLRQVIETAHERGLKSMAITFDHTLRREQLLTTLDEKLSLISKTGIQQVMSLTGLSGGSDDFFYITGAKDLAKIEGLANLKLADITWGNMCNLEEIKLGLDNGTFTNTIVSARTLGFDNAIFSSCKLLILAGLTNVVDPNLSGFVVLETLNCKRMSSLTGITMPSVNSLITIYLPSNIRTLALDNKTNLELLAIEESNDIEGENLTDITVTSSSEYAALKALDLLGNYIS